MSEVVEINGADRFFEINADPEFMALENEAKANPRKYAYRPNRNPDRQCTGLGAMHQRPGGAQIQVECPDNCPDSTNVMSYNNFPANQAVFSKCQLREME